MYSIKSVRTLNILFVIFVIFYSYSCDSSTDNMELKSRGVKLERKLNRTEKQKNSLENQVTALIASKPGGMEMEEFRKALTLKDSQLEEREEKILVEEKYFKKNYERFYKDTRKDLDAANLRAEKSEQRSYILTLAIIILVPLMIIIFFILTFLSNRNRNKLERENLRLSNQIETIDLDLIE